MTNLPRAILFDLDDTIMAYEAAGEGCWQEACAQYVTVCNGPTVDTLNAAIQAQSKWFWGDPERFRQGRLNLEEARRQVVMRALEVLGAPNPAVAEKIARLRTALHEQRIAPFPGAIEVLRKIRGAGSTRLGLVTNGASDKQRAKINQHGLETFFDCIVVEGEFGCGKPDERVFRHALQMLETAPADAWMVGDNLLHDIAPAQALGLRGIWHDFRGKGLPADAPCLPARTIRRLDELLPCKEARA